MNRTVKEATIRVFHDDDLERLKAHVLSFVTAYNFTKHLKALKWKIPFQSIGDAWTSLAIVLPTWPKASLTDGSQTGLVGAPATGLCRSLGLAAQLKGACGAACKES